VLKTQYKTGNYEKLNKRFTNNQLKNNFTNYSSKKSKFS
jgi:hypothetical protein